MSPNYESNFVCECGKTFTSPQSFNGHKSNCKIHHLSKYGSLDVFDAKYTKVAAKISSVTDRAIKVLYQEDLKYAFDWVKQHYTYSKLEDLYESR